MRFIVKERADKNLKVTRMVSFCCPQSVPVSCLTMFSLGLAFFTFSPICLWKTSWGSNVTPKILWFLSRGRGLPSKGTVGWRCDCWNSEVKSVTMDFWAEMRRLLSCSLSVMSPACFAIAAGGSYPINFTVGDAGGKIIRVAGTRFWGARIL